MATFFQWSFPCYQNGFLKVGLKASLAEFFAFDRDALPEGLSQKITFIRHEKSQDQNQIC